MSGFGSTLEEKDNTFGGQSKFKKTLYLSTPPGEYRIRILDEVETKKYAHFAGKTYVECLKDACPICENNRGIMYQHPDNFRDVKGWIPRRERYYVNVMDRTPAKVCDKCETENGTSSSNCDACNSPLGDVGPVNKVKILSSGPTLIDDITAIANSIRDSEDQVVDIRTYDWILLSRGQGREKTITVRPDYIADKASPLDYESIELYDLDNALITLEPDEMVDLLNGASIKDVFSLRRAKKEDSSTNQLADEVRERIDQSVKDIFKN